MNLDAGEHEDEPEELWQLFDLLNVACGGHAGDAASMARVAGFCAAHRIKLGAHPSYPDREGFGRTSITIEPAALTSSVREQCAALAAVAREHGIAVEAIKPHGALYHDAARSEPIARAVLVGAREALGQNVLVIGPAGGAMRDVARSMVMPYAREGFADRRLQADGSLVPRTQPDALLVDPAEAAVQALALRERVDTICVHADTPGAVAIARAVREALDA